MPTGANNKKKHTYIWVSAIILIFGIFAVYEVTKRVKGGTIVENDRMSVSSKDIKVGFVVNQGEKRRVPNFSFYDQDSVLVTNEDYLGKVYVVDFFFTTCPTICPVMTKILEWHPLQSTQDMTPHLY